MNIISDSQFKDSPTIRYIRTGTTGEFVAGIVYKTIFNNESGQMVLGAYYGYAGGGEYDGGYFFIDIEKDIYQTKSYDEAEESPSAKHYNTLMGLCGEFFSDDEPADLSKYSKELLANCPPESDGSRVFCDELFDGDMLSQVSDLWVISLRFIS